MYLVLHTKQPVTSKELAQRFWPLEAQNSLGEQSDYPNVRQALGPDAERLTRPYRGAVLFDVTGVEVDSFDRLANTPAHDRSWPAAYERAVELCQGHLLAHWNEPWLVGPRKKRKRDYETLLRELIGWALQQEEPQNVERFARLLLQSLPDDENALRGWERVRANASHLPKVNEIREPLVPDKVVRDEAVTPEAETLPLDAAGGQSP